MHHQNAPGVFQGVELVIQVVAQLLREPVKVCLRGGVVRLQQLFEGQHGVGLTGAVFTFYPDRQLLKAADAADQIPHELDKRLMGIELLPKIGMLLNDAGVDGGEKLRVYVKVVSVQLGHDRFLLILCFEKCQHVIRGLVRPQGDAVQVHLE